MILILSNDGDLSCDIVERWLNYYKYPWSRLNAFDILNNDIEIKINDMGRYVISIGKKMIKLEDIKAVWYRKFGFFRDSITYQRLKETSKLDESEINHIVKEFSKVMDVILLALKDKSWLTNPFDANLNKVEVLRMAKKCGLTIPKTVVTNSLNVICSNKKLISKSILDPTIVSWDNANRSMMYTTRVTQEDMEYLPHRFFPSLLQTEVEKDFEIRTFYIDGEFYSMAIFSQLDEQTKLDFRNYNWEKPNRVVPCEISAKTKQRLHNLMVQLNLNCGSIDLIKGRNGNLYFLEINPTGQFGMIDFPCNYKLHQKVAKKLIELDSLI